MTIRILPMVAALILGGCATAASVNDPFHMSPGLRDEAALSASDPAALLDASARRYVALLLEAGTHDAELVDAYYGPAEWRAQAQAAPRDVATLIDAARREIRELDTQVLPHIGEGVERRRATMLWGQLTALLTRLHMVRGARLSFADEARGQFGVEPEPLPLARYDAVLARLETLVPGDGTLAARVDAFNERYTIPPARLRAVFDAAIAECRRRTMQHMALPDGESFTIEFVTGKPWSGYNYYQGGYRSLIQINTDLPVRIGRAVDLGCHEGYPGHHVLNLMVESRLARGPASGAPQGRGWAEYLVQPLYSPTSVISEGSANYGIELAFPGEERLVFERSTLFPLAGLDPAGADALWRVTQATEALAGARLTIAKMYLDGSIDRARAVELTQRYLLLSPARAEQSVAFTDHYRSYVLNYGWGRDLVRSHVERGGADQATRWRRMETILSEPTLPSDLAPQ